MAIDTTNATVTRNGVSAPLESEAGRGILEGAVRSALGDSLELLPYPIPETDRFIGTRGYLPADDLETIAEQLIEAYPEHVGHLEQYSIAFLWKGKANKRGWTKAANDLVGHYAQDIDFIIWLGADVLREEQFTHGQVRKQVFHELLHIVEDDKGRIGVRADHDFEGFEVELELFGPWTAELARAKRAMAKAPPPSMGPLFEDLDDDDEDLGVE
jgi:hypothetical protein